MTARNDITGDKIKTGTNSEAYRNNKFFDRKEYKTPAKPAKPTKPLPTKTELDRECANLLEYLKTCTTKPKD